LYIECISQLIKVIDYHNERWKPEIKYMYLLWLTAICLSVFNKFIVYNFKFCTIATFVIVDIETTYCRQCLDSVTFICLPTFMCLAKWLCSYLLRCEIQQYSSHSYHVIFNSAKLLLQNNLMSFHYVYYDT
jgi:hypothetical protein